VPTLAAAAVLLCVGFAAVALAASSSSHRPSPALSVSAPGEVTSGARFAVGGRVAHLGATGGPVVVQVDEGGGWRTVGHARVVGHRFEVSCFLTGEGEARLRATLRPSSGSSIRSAPRRLEIRPAPAPPTQPSPPPSSPPAATTQVAPAPPAETPALEPPPLAGDY
jgi:hypothetical protein